MQAISTFQVLIGLIVVGVLRLVNTCIPMQVAIQSNQDGVVEIAVVVWLLNLSGLLHALANLRVAQRNRPIRSRPLFSALRWKHRLLPE